MKAFLIALSVFGAFSAMRSGSHNPEIPVTSTANRFSSPSGGAEFLLKQADSIKTLLAKDGFTVLREAPLNMESGYEFPIVVPMNERNWYHFVFIGEANSSLYEVRMYDYDEKQVVYQKKRWGDIDGNIIHFSYIPKFSEYHVIKPVQINKKKQVNGYVILLKKAQ